MNPLVDISLATHNGAAYLMDFLGSLESQDASGWRLLARDDGSTDGTLSLLSGFARNRAGTAILRTSPTEGAIRNFAEVLAASSAPYIMPADQDDIWLPHRIRTCVDGIRALEGLHGTGTPALFFTDLEVVDENLHTICGSFWRHEGLSPDDGLRLERLVVRNVSPGCAMIVNRALMNAALPLPPEALMHDWWLMMVACAVGVMAYDVDTTVKYRQHSANVLGARRRSVGARLRRFMLEGQKVGAIVRATQQQAGALLERHRGLMDERSSRTLSAYCNADQHSPAAHRLACLRAGIRSNGLLSTVGLYALL